MNWHFLNYLHTAISIFHINSAMNVYLEECWPIWRLKSWESILFVFFSIKVRFPQSQLYCGYRVGNVNLSLSEKDIFLVAYSAVELNYCDVKDARISDVLGPFHLHPCASLLESFSWQHSNCFSSSWIWNALLPWLNFNYVSKNPKEQIKLAAKVPFLNKQTADPQTWEEAFCHGIIS